MTRSSSNRSPGVATYLLTASILCGCAKPTVSVDVHGVNYSGNEFSYLLVNQSDPDSSSVGERIDPFAAGGTTCCYSLPKQWRPGIKVQIRTTHWLPKDADGNLPEVKEEHVVEVPPYVDGKAGELWVVREADGSVSVVSSNFQPDHPRWPGKLKGWPVPSLEYRRERWELLRQLEESNLNMFAVLLAELEKSPRERAVRAWENAQQYERDSLRDFSGPSDPKYIKYLHERYVEEFEESRARLKELTEMRP